MRGFSNQLHPPPAFLPISDYPGVTCCQDGNGRLHPIWASKILFRNLWVTSLRPFFFTIYGSDAKVPLWSGAPRSVISAEERCAIWRFLIVDDKNVSMICFWRNIIVLCYSAHSISCSSGAARRINIAYCTAPHKLTSVLTQRSHGTLHLFTITNVHYLL